MKVKFNLPTKRYNSKFSNDFNSTFDFGYIQSSLTKFVVPKSKFSINVSQLVRTAPLVVPTFGRMAVHNLFTYVPMSLIFPAFDAFISQTQVNGALKTYTPNSLPSITNNMLVCMLLGNQLYSKYIAYPSNSAGSNSIKNRKFSYFNGATISVPDSLTLNVGYSDLGKHTWDYHIIITNDHYEGFYKLTEFGRSVYNVLRSLGYSMDYYDTAPVSVLPILSFIKASYDLLFPKRDLAWHSTEAYDMINKYYNGLIDSRDDGSGHVTDFFVSTTEFSDTLIDALLQFVNAPLGRNLSNIATATPILDTNVPSFKFPTSSGVAPTHVHVNGDVYGSTVGGSINSQDGIPSESIRIADKLWSFVQRSSVVGQDVANWFKVHFGVKPTEDMFSHSWLIRDVVNRLNVNTVVSTADTQSADSGEVLGGLAGQSYSAASSKVTFEAPNFGYLLCLTYVIPVCGVSSGTQPELYNTSYFDMPFPDFDGLGYEALNNTSFQEFEGPAKSNNYTRGFGYVPRMTSYKTLNNVRSGGFALPSLRDNYLPYCLDNVNIQTHHVVGSETQLQDFIVFNSQTLAWYFPYGVPTGSDVGQIGTAYNPWRVFNNIFYNSFDSDNYLGMRWSPNNFMVQSSFDVNVSSYLKPISDSYELDQLGKSITSVEKS